MSYTLLKALNLNFQSGRTQVAGKLVTVTIFVYLLAPLWHQYNSLYVTFFFVDKLNLVTLEQVYYGSQICIYCGKIMLY